MRSIGGNKQAVLQVKTTTQNTIGEDVETWRDYMTLTGFLDLASGESTVGDYNAKLQESTHVFICDYVAIDCEETESRLLVDGKAYEVTLIDDPMELHLQIEIYLSYTGD